MSMTCIMLDIACSLSKVHREAIHQNVIWLFHDNYKYNRSNSGDSDDDCVRKTGIGTLK